MIPSALLPGPGLVFMIKIPSVLLSTPFRVKGIGGDQSPPGSVLITAEAAPGARAEGRDT